ncbi:sugar-binding protein [Opitutaceae bacterium TAV5]|nr:sugar-binding protein [Opitutaceae bacterium TAV5]
MTSPSRRRCCLVLTLLLVGLISVLGFQALNLLKAQPAWWMQQGVLDPAAAPDDYAAANIGQLKHITTQAAAEMNAHLPGGAGPAINALVTSWQQPPATGVTRDDYAAVNLGQLKAVAQLFYNRLATAGIVVGPVVEGSSYPWPTDQSGADNYALVNVGQLKHVFSFTVPSGPPGFVDTDGNGIDDNWELAHFGQIGIDPTADPDGDGLSNLAEYLADTDPTLAAQTVPPAALALTVYSP